MPALGSAFRCPVDAIVLSGSVPERSKGSWHLIWLLDTTTSIAYQRTNGLHSSAIHQ